MRIMVVADSPENLATEWTLSPKSILAASRLFPSTQVAIFITGIPKQINRRSTEPKLDGLSSGPVALARAGWAFAAASALSIFGS